MSTEAPLKCDSGTGSARERVLPDPTICRARILSEDLPDCVVDNPDSCRYVFSVGTRCFCNHPQRAKIIANTEAANTHVGADLANRRVKQP